MALSKANTSIAVETDSGHTFIGDTMVDITIPQLKLEVDMDQIELKGVEDAWLICFEQEAERMIQKYSTF